MARLLLVLCLLVVALIAASRASVRDAGNLEPGPEAQAGLQVPDDGPAARATPAGAGPVADSPASSPTVESPAPLQEVPVTEGRPVGVTVAPAGPSRTPTIDRLARLESRRRLFRSARHTFIDSLFVTPDSIVRRWPDRRRKPLEVFASVPDSLALHASRTRRAVDAAMGRWDAVPFGFGFRWTADSAAADVQVFWVPQFGSDRSGQAEVRFDQAGVIHQATVTLALRDGRGRALGDADLAIVATHEFGHVLGLPHSGRSSDLMFPTSRVSTLSRRDKATAILIYSLLPGPMTQPAQ